MRKLLHELGFSVPRPRRVRARADRRPQDPLAALYLSPAKKKARPANRALIFTDEARFRQDSTLHATWSRLGHPPEVPVTGGT